MAVPDTAASTRLRTTASSASLPRLPSSYRTCANATGAIEQPSLADLIRAEQQREQEAIVSPQNRVVVEGASPHSSNGTKPRARRRSSAPLAAESDSSTQPKRPTIRTSDTMPALSTSASWSQQEQPHHDVLPAILLPPHYGRPARPSSPDAFAALFRPVLRSLSRPASPSISPRSSLLFSRDNVPSKSPSLTSAPIDRSASSLPAQFPPREPTDPAPTVESQGFVLYIGSLVAYVAYLVWAFLPEEWLVKIGIEWYPHRDWALLVPAWIVMLVAFTYVSYFFLTMYSTPSSSLPEPYDDPRAYIPPPARPPLDPNSFGTARRPPTPLWAHGALLPEEAIPPLYDLPIEVVRRVLYPSDEEEDEDEGGVLQEDCFG